MGGKNFGEAHPKTADVEVVPPWMDGARLGQMLEIGIIDLTSFGKRNGVARAADVRHAIQSGDRYCCRCNTASVLNGVAHWTKWERTKFTMELFEPVVE